MTVNTTPETFTEIILTGSREEVDILMTAARQSGRLVWAKAPAPVSVDDPRTRVLLRLTPSR